MKRDIHITHWVKWLEVIKEDISNLLNLQYVHSETRKLVDHSPRSHSESYFSKWFTLMYFKTASAEVMRQAEWNTNSTVLGKLLCDIQHHPESISLRRFEWLYTEELPTRSRSKKLLVSIQKSLAQADFRELCGKTVSGRHIDPDLVMLDLLSMIRENQKIQRIVGESPLNRQTRIEENNSIATLDRAIFGLRGALEKYTHLIEGIKYHADVEPAADWQKIFSTVRKRSHPRAA